MRNLLIVALVGFFAGVALRSFFAFGIEYSILLIVIGASFGIIYATRDEYGKFLIQAAFLLIAFSLGALRFEIQDSREHLVEFQEKLGEQIEISGKISEDPQKLEKFTRAILETDRDIKILLTLPHFPEIKYGDKLLIRGTLAEPENFSDFNWKRYLSKDNIYFEMFLPEIKLHEEGGGFWLKRNLFKLKHAFLNNLSQVLPEPHSSFLAGVTIGEKTSLPEAVEEKFRAVGVIHLIVLSGYNISIISDYSVKALGLLPITKLLRTFIATGGIILFALLTGASSTVVRAAIMGILLLWVKETGKVYQALTALIFAAFVMILFNPKILIFDASFQLSFLATAGLIFLSPRLEKIFKRVPNFWHLRDNLVATLSAQIFVLPLLIHLGGTFSWVTIPSNLLILSAMPVTMFFGFITGLAGFVSYYLSWILAWPAYWLLAYELWVVEIFSRF